uniref:Uncharacterized protein n=1 Tax=Populus alba TaxID=43335 RepID=A0A4U5R3P4_POPAL|nr:hypothetical protein D5086_0000004810 [Populus alba]
MDALGEDELESARGLHSNEKFMSLNLLSHPKGKLRYLKTTTRNKICSSVAALDPVWSQWTQSLRSTACCSCGANGLNLLEAQHVVLVEPLLNPAAEAQAVS